MNSDNQLPARSSTSMMAYGLTSASVVLLAISGISLVWMSPRQSARELPKLLQAREPKVVEHTVEDLSEPLAQFESVFWEPRDTDSLRKRIRESDWVREKSVLEIGTGTGLVALCCLRAGAANVVATDINPAAVANAQHNAVRCEYSDRIDVRLVPLRDSFAFSVIDPAEQFDLIVSNPPWENGIPRSIAEHALYDPGFHLLQSLLSDAHRHLKPSGRIWLAYGCVEAIQKVQELAPRYGWRVNWLDERQMSELAPVFLPGLLLELTQIE